MNNRDNLSLLPNPQPAEAAHAPARLATWLITRAARQAPPELAARLEEEWLADLATRRTATAQLLFALGCGWATQVITHDSLVFGTHARGVLGGQGTLTAFAPSQLAPGSNRSTVVMLVLALHVVVIYAFVTGIIRVPQPDEPGPLVVSVDPVQSKPPPLPPGPRIDLTGQFNPKPFDPGPIEISVPAENPPEPGPGRTGTAGNPAHAIVRVAGGPGVGFPNAEIFYPPAAIREGQSGAVGVRVCVDERGRLVGDPAIADSSGYARLDQGALALARAGSGHYRSTTEGGRPVNGCFAYRVRFRLP